MLEPIVQKSGDFRIFFLGNLAMWWKLLSKSGDFRNFGRMFEPFVRIWQFQNFWRDAGTFCVNMALSDSFCPNLATSSQNFPKKIRWMIRTGFLLFVARMQNFATQKNNQKKQKKTPTDPYVKFPGGKTYRPRPSRAVDCCRRARRFAALRTKPANKPLSSAITRKRKEGGGRRVSSRL